MWKSAARAIPTISSVRYPSMRSAPPLKTVIRPEVSVPMIACSVVASSTASSEWRAATAAASLARSVSSARRRSVTSRATTCTSITRPSSSSTARPRVSNQIARPSLCMKRPSAEPVPSIASACR